MTLQRQQKIELTIERLAYGGAGVGHVAGITVFVQGTAPGDRVRARVTKRKAQHAEAHLMEILEPSPVRREPPCPLVGNCGGCRWQHIPEADQIAAKEAIIAETFEHLGKIPHGPIEPIQPSPESLRYRNKMDLTFGRDEEGNVTLGFHRAGHFDQVIDVPECLLQPESFDAIIAVFREHARREGLEPHDPRDHSGFLRSVIVREGKATGETLAILLTKTGDLPERERLVEDLRTACPGLRCFLWGINTAKADIAQIERLAWTWGEPAIHDRIGDQTFAISPMAFFQTNTRATETLYRLTRDALDLTGEETLLDAFCGTGTIGIFCAPRCRQVLGVELHLPAVQDARRNAADNGLKNCTFLAGDVRQTLPLARQVARPAINRVVVDPPRGGMHRKALAQLIALDAPVFVYVSCNPTTLARDLQDLHIARYSIDRVWPLDMFPQTHHVETVVRLTR
jgi:23S rRNA (uracil1939-C5)-methyltransferase